MLIGKWLDITKTGNANPNKGTVMVDEKRKNALSQEQFEAISKRAAEVGAPMAAKLAIEMVRKEMLKMRREQTENATHDLYAVIGEAGFKELVKMGWFLLKTLCVVGVITILGYLGVKGHILK